MASGRRWEVSAKAIAGVVALLMTTSVMGGILFSAEPASADSSGGFEYSLINGGSDVEINGYTGSGGNVIIPSSIDGKPVVSIAANAFVSRSSITNLSIPDSVQSIGEYAFWQCTSMVNVWIGSGVQSIGRAAFSTCSALTTATIPDSVTSLGDYTFELCSSLSSAEIPMNLTSMGLTPFWECTSLGAIEVNPGNPAFSSIDGILYNKDASVLLESPCVTGTQLTIPSSVVEIGFGGLGYCHLLTTVHIPSSVTTIGSCAFQGCSALTSLTIPASVTSIGNYAFWMCSFLSQLTFSGDAPQVGYEWALDCSSSLTAYYPEGAYGFTTPTWNGIHAYPMGSPGVPSSLAVEPGNSQVQLHWSIPLWDGGSAISGYLVYRSSSSSGPYSLIATTQQLGCTDGSLNNGQIYWYEVSAVNHLGEGSRTTAIAARPCVEAPSLTAFSPAPNSTMDSAPSIITVNISRGLPADNFTSVTITLDGTQLAATVSNDVAHGVVPMNISAGRHSVVVSVAFVEMTKTASWSFTVLEGPAPAGFSLHNSTKGYAILVPDGWTVQDDAMVAGNQTDTLIWGPISSGYHTNVIVKTGTDASIRDTQSYLSQMVQSTIGAINQQGGNAVMTGTQQYVKISNYSAVVFGIDNSYAGVNAHQEIALIIDASHSRYWMIVCTESRDDRTQLDPIFSTIIYGFTITSVPGLSNSDLFVLVAIIIVIGAILVTLAFVLLRRKEKRRVTPPPYVPIQENASMPSKDGSGKILPGDQAQTPPSQNQNHQSTSTINQDRPSIQTPMPSQSTGQPLNYCPWCGAQAIGSQFCGNCGKKLKRME